MIADSRKTSLTSVSLHIAIMQAFEFSTVSEKFIQTVDHWDSLWTLMLTPYEKSTPPHVNGVHRAIFEIVRERLWQLLR